MKVITIKAAINVFCLGTGLLLGGAGMWLLHLLDK